MLRPPLLVVALLLAAACARARGGEQAAPAPTTARPVRDTTPSADLRFIRGMMAHHAQALVMTALVPSRSGRADIRRLAERIEVSQRDEIALMQQWLRRRGEPERVPGQEAHDHAGHGAGGDMPGMLTPAQLDSLRSARGETFDRRFLEYMIQHHEGALAMVAALLGSRGGASESEIFRLAADIDADQRAEIQRMRALLGR